ncbi:crystallin J1C [Aplysia californica]|uniref:Crystallin J1C n=1 Tax=Aplysia californica TaxID=6500 RepID=A0ABM0JG04_APLCA|nr:crystallin J1C [Aplysia californica]
MATVSELTPLQQRKVAAIVGACVADAAAQPLHWIYKDDVMAGLIEGKEEIEFRDPSANPFYRLPNGRNTTYFEQTYVLLKSLVESKGLNTDQLKKATYEFFGPNSEYEIPRTTMPIEGPWRHGGIRDFIANVDAKKERTGSETDEQIDSVVRVIPLVALYAGQPDFLKKAEEGLRVLQESNLTISCGLAAARALEQIILTGKSDNIVQNTIYALNNAGRSNPVEKDRTVAGLLQDVLKASSTSHVEAVPTFKKSCQLPGSLQSAMHGVLTVPGYVDSVRTTIRAGGCNASRSGFIGACRAAQEGFDAIPESWRQRTKRYEEVLALALALVKLQE